MQTIETAATIIVRPRSPDGWVVVTPRLRSEIYFHGRQRALQFARAYASLHRPATLRVLSGTGDIEAEEIFADTLRDSGHAMLRAKVVTLVSPSSSDRRRRAAD